MKDKSSKWILVSIIAAVVATLTTVTVLVLRAGAKKKKWYEEQADFDFDLDDADDLEAIDGASEQDAADAK